MYFREGDILYSEPTLHLKLSLLFAINSRPWRRSESRSNSWIVAVMLVFPIFWPFTLVWLFLTVLLHLSLWFFVFITDLQWFYSEASSLRLKWPAVTMVQERGRDVGVTPPYHHDPGHGHDTSPQHYDTDLIENDGVRYTLATLQVSFCWVVTTITRRYILTISL